MMTVKKIENSNEWEQFNKKQLNTLFVQSWKYGEFYKKLGEQFWVYGVYDDNNELVGGTLAVSIHAKRGNYIFVPYGPVIKAESTSKYEEIFLQIINELKTLAMKQNYSFIRISPFIDDNEQSKNVFSNLGFRPSPIHSMAENTWILNLEQSEEDLMMGMKKNHRNLVRRCLKEKVKFEMRNDTAGLKEFNRLHDETAKRHKFHRFSADYINKEFGIFSEGSDAVIFNAYLPKGDLDASAIVMFYGDMAVYRHGASLGLDKKIPTSYLIQWEAIREAKNRGIKWYNFWGIAPENAHIKHPFKGITHFKKGFGGEQKDLLPSQDLPISTKYWITWTIEIVRKKIRGFG